MRSRIALPATLAAMVLAITLGQQARAQQETGRAPARAGENQNANRNTDRDRNQNAATETIHGIVAGITAEGEATFDYRSNRATMADAAFLTVVGSPAKIDSSRPEGRASAHEGEKAGASMGNKRHNVYMVWLTPRTKICERSAESGKTNAADRQESLRTKPGQADKKECNLDQLEVGDRVEIQFNVREESGANSVAHQTEQMRQKHGRNRTYVGYATEVTIMSPRDEDRTDSAAARKPGAESR